MKHKKSLIAGIAVIVIIALAFAGYNIYRHPAMFRGLSDNSLNDSQVEEVREEILSQSDTKVLVAYFSYSGTTRNIANSISEKTGGDLFEITPQKSYSNVYMESNSEIRNNERPSLTGTVENMEEYDIVFVGYPVWWHATPAPVNTFLESYDLTGKLIIPFCTSGGSDIDETMPTFLNSCDGLAVYGERRISGTSELDRWLSELGLKAASAADESVQKNTDTDTETEAESGDTANEKGAEAMPASDTDGIPTLEMHIYEYEIQEFYARRDKNRIYGLLYVPKNSGEKMPVVIFSHGFGGNYQVGTQYAEALAQKGYVVYCFDFCGGSPESRSDGSTLDMSIFTEQADLEAVIHMMKEQSFVDKEKIFLMGTSQGGAVSAITAAANKEEIKGAILLYPAFVLVDRTKEQFENVEDIPDTYDLMWMTVGRAYAENLLDYDIYAAISTYDKDVLLIHGDADSIVPLSYSEKALEAYDSARLEVLAGAGHGFSGEDARQAIDWILEYLNTHKI